MTHFSRQNGFSLVELMLALGIGVLVMAAVYTAYDGRRNDAEVAVMVADMEDLIYKANMAYVGSNQYAVVGGTTVPVNTQRLNDAAGGLPAAFLRDTTKASGFSHYWASQATVGAASTDAGVTLDLLTVSLDDIPPVVCLDLVGQIAPRMYDTRIDGSLVGLSPARNAASQGRYNIRVEQVAPLCNKNQNDIVFRYMKPFDYSIFRSRPASKTFAVVGPGYFDEGAAIQPNFNRVEAAMNAREAAQVAIP